MMKKLILTLTAIVTISSVFAQRNKVVAAWDYEKAFLKWGKCTDLKKGLDAINSAIENEKTKAEAKTWFYRGNLYFNLLVSKDKNCKALEADALTKCTDSYFKTLVLNFEDPELKKLDLDKEEDLMKFAGAMQNQSPIENPEYTGKIIMMKFPGLASEYANKGIKEFTAKDYKASQKSFGKSLMLGSFSGRMDTMVMYNTALASEYAEDYDAAKELYDGLIKLKYNVDNNGPNLYAAMAKIYNKEGDEEKAMEYIKKGREAYPNNNNLLVSELDYYLRTGNHAEAIDNLDIAIAADPNNATYYFARGSVYDNLKHTDKAVADYKKAIEIQPEYFDANFNLGAFYYNMAADKINEANKLPLDATKKYNALKAEAKNDFASAVPYIEAANKAKPDDIDTANMLIKVYTQTGQYDKAKEIKAKYQ
jgi:tetratricopeptide (TPR) repeat protein